MTAPDPTAADYVALARKHLRRVQAAWDEPTDWSDLTIYGMYALEAAILGAATCLGIAVKKTHWAKAECASVLAADHGLPDVSDLVEALNIGRKAVAYGDAQMPGDELGDAQDLATQIEDFVVAVETLVRGASP